MKMLFLLILIFKTSFAVASETNFECLNYVASDEEQTLAIEELKNALFYPSLPRPSNILTKEEATIITSYTAWFYRPMNDALRSDRYYAYTYPRLSILNVIKTLCSALTKLPELNSEVLYRAVAETPEVLNFYQDGSIITEKAFLSTSTSRSGIRSFLRQQAKHVRKLPRHIVFIIHTKKAKDITAFSEFPKEREALIPAGLKFKVTVKGRSLFKNTLEIVLDQVDS